jgi:beta-phosphoglucomutase-like phosphatase (HAD superfamily)
MTLDGMIFDIDGTLVDTNPAHVEAWVRAFADLGYRVPADRIGRELGKGGDQLVPSVLGDEAEHRIGDRLREAQRREYLAIAACREFEVFPGVPELLEALATRGIRTALATSSNLEHLRGTPSSAGIDLPAMADELVTKDDAGASKPARREAPAPASPGSSAAARESRALLEEWLRVNGNPEQRPFVAQLLMEVEG